MTVCLRLRVCRVWLCVGLLFCFLFRSGGLIDSRKVDFADNVKLRCAYLQFVSRVQSEYLGLSGFRLCLRLGYSRFGFHFGLGFRLHLRFRLGFHFGLRLRLHLRFGFGFHFGFRLRLHLVGRCCYRFYRRGVAVEVDFAEYFYTAGSFLAVGCSRSLSRRRSGSFGCCCGFVEGNVFSAASELLYQQFGDVILNSEVGVVVFHFYIFFAQKSVTVLSPTFRFLAITLILVFAIYSF